MTEDEARKKWCPYMGAESMAQEIKNMQPLPPGYGRSGGCGNPTTYQEQNRCIASDCMSWRWLLTEKPGRDVPLGVKEKVTGYCGLAGEP